MSGKGFLRTLIAACLATGATSGAFYWDQARTRAHEEDFYLRWARQISTQVESMTLTAQERGELDPLNWSVSFLTQGVEPRTVKIFITPPEVGAGEAGQTLSDTYHLDKTKNYFEYSKTILPEDRRGVRIQISAPFTGFLGSHGPLANDALLTALWSLLFSCFFLLTRRRSADGETIEQPSFQEPALQPEPKIIYRDVPVPATDELRPILQKWVGEARELLSHLGRAVRDVLRDAQLMVGASVKSQAAVESLHRRLHAELRDLHAGRQALEETQKVITLAKAVTGHAAAEAAALGPNGGQVARLVDQVQRLLREMEKQNQLGAKAVKKLEVSLEPLVTDADIAFAAQTEITRTLTGVNDHIDQTKLRLLGQARLIQELNQELKTRKSAG